MVVGFHVDEWTDFIPNVTETKGIAFQYETPQAEAPQALLLAVPPIINDEKWTDDGLSEIIADTIDMMRIRSVSSEQVFGSNLSIILPQLFFDRKSGEKQNEHRFPTVPLKLFDGVIKGGVHYITKDDPLARRQ